MDIAKYKRVNKLLGYLMLAIGVSIGYAISRIPDVQIFKLFNIFGIFFDIVGVLLLTYAITSNPKIKYFICTWGASISISLVAFIPTGLLASQILILISAAYLPMPSTINYFNYSIPIIIFSMSSIFFLEDVAFSAKFKIFESEDSRIKALGGYFLVTGLSMQLYASVLDLLVV